MNWKFSVLLQCVCCNAGAENGDGGAGERGSDG